LKKINSQMRDAPHKFCVMSFVLDKTWWRITHLEQGATLLLIPKLKAL